MAWTRGVALALAGLWLGLLFASWISATASFAAVNRVLREERPELLAKLAPVAPDDRVLVLRHLAAEANRWMFSRWAVVQLCVACALVLAAWPAAGWPRALAIAAAAIAVAQLPLGSAIEALGRSIDFVPRPLPADLGRRFGLLHAAFVLLDLLKGVVLGTCAVVLARLPLK